LFALCSGARGAAPVDAQAQPPVAAFAEPSVSPDHSEIAFLLGGDIWSVPSSGGVAHLLADTGGTAERPLFSPDGKRLAFVSTRRGNVGIQVLDLDGGRLHRVTYDDAPPELDAWSADGRYLYFASAERTIAYQTAIRRVPADGGTPVDVRAEAYVNQMDAAPAPDGSALAYVRNGFDQWWRHGHSHIDQTSILIEHPASHSFESITHGQSEDRWPMWSSDGSVLYFASDRGGREAIWKSAGGTLRAVTPDSAGHLVYPTISRDGRLIAFERDLEIWTYDTQSGVTSRVSIEPRGLSTTVQPSRESQSGSFGAFDLAPDGKKLAFIARGRMFAADASDGGEAVPARVRDLAAADEPAWSHDSRSVAFVLDRGDEQAIATYVFPDGPEKIITPPGHHDDYPHWSPDGTKLEFLRDGRELHVLDVATHADRILARGTFDRRPFGEEDDVAFSPDGSWLAYVDNPPGGFSNAYIVPAAGGAAHAVTALPNTNTGPLVWAPDGERLYLTTSQRTEDGVVAQVDLIPRAPRFREDTFRHLFDESPLKPEHTVPASPAPRPSTAASPSPAPSPSPEATATERTRIDFNGIEQRVTLLQTGVDVARVVVTADGKTLILDANAAGQQNLYSFSVDETSADERVATQLTNTSGSKGRIRVAPDGKSVVYQDDGRFWRVGVDGKDAKPLGVSASFDVDFEHDKRVVFAQVWSTLDRWYADPHFHGTDWAAERRKYEPYALAAHTRAEFARIVSLMIGELNSSHSGFRERTPGGDMPAPIGQLGATFDPVAYERDGKLRFSDIVPLGPLALAGGVKVGDQLEAVDGVAVDPHTDVSALLANTAGKRTELRIASGGTSAATRTVVVLPVDVDTDHTLRYRQWVAGRRAYVERLSGGKIGYVHLADMELGTLQKFFTDLDVQNREKRGVVIDIRNNEGGFVDPYAIDVLARREYLRFRSRFGNDAPPRTALGQRALDKPTVLVVNEHTLSDGENFTEGYRRLHLGRVVGVPTAGWIIFTSESGLADGSQMRIPSTSVLTDDGVDMELHPRPVDITVDTSPAASERGDDPQLDAAVRVLL
jgi:Tol biopolymer transport system component/C-terminal processing protease CtpA/Prc